MPPRDLIHNAVRQALEKAGWNITADPFTFSYKRIQVHADLEAERIVEAEQDGRRIVVEIKSFVGLSAVNDFENALGQYEFYRHLLTLSKSPQRLYMAVSESTYQVLLAKEGFGDVIELSEMALFTVNLTTKEIIRWIEPKNTAPW